MQDDFAEIIIAQNQWKRMNRSIEAEISMAFPWMM